MGIFPLLRIVMLGFACVPCSFAQLADPCLPGTYVKTVPHPRDKSPRSVNYTTPTSDEEIPCDRDLDEGWYIFLAPEDEQSQVPTSLDMPTECVPNYRCGSRYTMWMKGSVPTTADGIVDRLACVNVRGSCCVFSVRINVRRCDSGLVAYYLVPPPGCPARYCFGDLAACPPGQGSATGFAPGCVPTESPVLNVDPTVEIQVSPASFAYSCTLRDDSGDKRLKYEISWVFELNGATSVVHTKEVTATDRHVIGFLTPAILQRIKNYFGNHIRCKVRSFFKKGVYSETRTSNRLFIGIEIVNYKAGIIELNEGEDLELELQLHAPYLGAEPLRLEVKVPQGAKGGAHCSTGEAIPQLVYGGCAIKFTRDHFRNNQTVKTKVKASMDNKIEQLTRWGNGAVLRTILLSTEDIVIPHLFWSNYVLPPIKILVKDVDGAVAVCRSVNDPHMKTFDGVSYELQKEGHFLLYKHTVQPFEVHAHFKSCNGNGRAPFCNCAVGILAAEDVIMFDKCGRGVIDIAAWGPSQTRLRMATRGTCRERRGTRILQENGGRRYVVQLATGTSVIVEDSYRTFINLYIEASQADFQRTTGLCGLFDGDCSNDLIPRNEMDQPHGYRRECGRSNPLHPHRFTDSWRLKPAESLLHWESSIFKDDMRFQHFDGHVYCTCAAGDQDVNLECRAGGDVPKCAARRYQRDVTDKRFESCRRRRDLEAHDHYDFLDYDEEEYSFVSQPREGDAELYGLDEVNDHTRHKRAQPYTEETAREFCESFVFGTNVAQRCSELNVDTDGPIEACVLDLLATDDTNWAVAALDTVKQQCMAELDKNTTRWVAPSPGANITVPPPEIEGAICFNECSGNGDCVNGTCECLAGFTAPDCSINMTRPPMLFYTPMCDLKSRPCNTNPVFGNNFVDNENLTCHFYRQEIDDSGIRPAGGAVIETPADFENYGEVKCPLPVQDRQTAPLAYKVHVSNNGQLKSRYGDLIIYNSVCYNCNVTVSRCTLKTNSCVIDDDCIPPGYTKPGDVCKTCAPARSRSQWTLKTDYCLINGTCVNDGLTKSDDVCNVCAPVQSQTTWTKSDAAMCNPTTKLVLPTSHIATTVAPEATTRFDVKETPQEGLADWHVVVIAAIPLVVLSTIVTVVVVCLVKKKTSKGTTISANKAPPADVAEERL